MDKRTLLKATALLLASPHSFGQGTGDVIRIIIPLGPGTPSDSVTRIVANALTEQLKRTIVVDNRPGANGLLAVQELMRAKPNGNTLMLGGISPVALNVAVVKDLPYDPRRDFTPIGGMYNAFQAYVVSNKIPVKSFQEFLAYAKKNPGKVSIGHYSALTQIQVAALSKMADVSFLAVPYKSTTNAYTDVMGGIIDSSIADIATAMNLSQSDKLKALAITLPERSSLAPGVPAVAETVPGYAFAAWSGLIGPAGMPKDVVLKLNAALNATLQQKETIAKMAEGAAQPWPTTPEEFAAHIDKEITRWVKLAKEAGIQPE